jgi:hypothetical protein
MTEVLKALVFYADGKSAPINVPAIEYEGRVWLAPHWIETPEPGVRAPKHIIPIDLFQGQKVDPPQPGLQYVVNAGLPRQLLDEEIPTELKNKFQIVDRPNVKVPTGIVQTR